MHIGFHHYHKKKEAEKAHEYNVRLMDKLIYAIGVFGGLVFIPQLLKVWVQGNIAGVSLLSWIGMFIGSIFWEAYGIIHREKPIIIINLMYAAIQILIVIGILIFR